MVLDETFEKLLMIPGVAGYEDDVRAFIESHVAELGDTHLDPLGNFTLTLGSGEPRLMFAAHMDEIGLVVSAVDEKGYLRFEKIGTIDNKVLPGRMVVVHTDKGPVPGAIGIAPPHLGGSGDPSPDSLAIDIGADNPEDVAKTGVELLNPVTFWKESRILNTNKLNCRGVDDRVGCYILMQLARFASQHKLNGTLIFAWSVQEEVGLRGARALSRTCEYDIAIPVDAFASSAFFGGTTRKAHVPLGSGPVLRMIDHGSMASRKLAGRLKELAVANKIPTQVGVTGGETDGVPLQERGAHMVPVTIPMRYTHSLAEMVDLRDVENARKLLEQVILNIESLKDL